MAVRAKSGGADWTTWKLTVTVWDRLPLVPVTVTFPAVGTVPPKIVRVDMADPPDESVTLLGLIAQLGHPGHAGFGGTVNVTVPENPFWLVRVIVELFENPVGTRTKDGRADIEKSGGGGIEETNFTVTE